MGEKAKKKVREDFEVMNSIVADDKEVQFLDDNQESKKMRKDNRLKSNEVEGDDQGKQMMKKKRSDAASQHEDHNEFISNEDKHDEQYKKKEEKKKKKKKLSQESKSKGYNDFESNEGGDDDQGNKMKKKKLHAKSKSKENCEFTSKQMQKKKSDAKSQHEDCNEFKGNEDKDDSQYKKEEKKRKKKKLSEESESKEYNEIESNEGEGEGKKRKKKKLGEESKSKEYNEFENNEGEDGGQGKKRKKKKLSEQSKAKEYNEFENNEGEDDGQGKKIKKKNKRDKSKNKENSEFNSNEGDVNEVDDQCKKMKTKEKAKRVTFSDKVDVCCDGLIRGKWFTPEEDETIRMAVLDYIESHGLGDEGLDMVLHCKSHPQVRNCWKEIGAALPNRPYVSVYFRAHILFERGEKRRWTPEEFEFLRKVKEQHGSDWKSVAEALGKHRFHVKDAWRRIRLANTNRGRWTQEEYQNLFDLVNQDLRVRASQGCRKSKHGMLRDNIGWEAIGDKLATRSSVTCCMKWYNKLTSPMVANGVWSDTDDYRLINALFTLDASCMEEVDWDNLIENRPGDVCRKRWNQMVQCIGENVGKSFAEQVEILAKRYCPDLLEAREAFDEKPLVC